MMRVTVRMVCSRMVNGGTQSSRSAKAVHRPRKRGDSTEGMAAGEDEQGTGGPRPTG